MRYPSSTEPCSGVLGICNGTADVPRLMAGGSLSPLLRWVTVKQIMFLVLVEDESACCTSFIPPDRLSHTCSPSYAVLLNPFHSFQSSSPPIQLEAEDGVQKVTTVEQREAFSSALNAVWGCPPPPPLPRPLIRALSPVPCAVRSEHPRRLLPRVPMHHGRHFSETIRCLSQMLWLRG